MLLNIRVGNFRSYDELQTLSMISSDGSEVNALTVGGFKVRKLFMEQMLVVNLTLSKLCVHCLQSLSMILFYLVNLTKI